MRSCHVTAPATVALSYCLDDVTDAEMTVDVCNIYIYIYTCVYMCVQAERMWLGIDTTINESIQFIGVANGAAPKSERVLSIELAASTRR